MFVAIFRNLIRLSFQILLPNSDFIFQNSYWLENNNIEINQRFEESYVVSNTTNEFNVTEPTADYAWKYVIHSTDCYQLQFKGINLLHTKICIKANCSSWNPNKVLFRRRSNPLIKMIWNKWGKLENNLVRIIFNQ